MNHPLVSVIVPCYNQAGYLGEALDSVLNQTYSNWECVIVNDGSPDNTEEIAKLFCNKDTRYRYVSQQNMGLSSARNTGVLLSKGVYILPLDADDLIDSTYIEKAVSYFIQFPNTKLVYCKANKFGKENGGWELPPYKYERLIWDNCIFCSAMYRRCDYDKTNGYNTNMVHGLEDWDFWLSLLKPEDIVYRIDEILFHYRVKGVSMLTSLAKHEEAAMIQLYKNHSEVYAPYLQEYCERIIYNKREKEELIELRSLRNRYEKVSTSFAYRLGKAVLKPVSIIKELGK